ncbi:MAG TPA: low molecular weight protein-tyrosine-phosphatase [Candidatus Limnocylindrales bacterium]|nr:low molecular weight protein-tyrosine-phosphatase [Candidatus Limnocylindrales bacterium]
MTVSVLFVCAGNICRSPMAEAVFRQQVKQVGLEDAFEIDSAGTGNWYAGQQADARTLAVLEKRSIPYEGRARQVTREDLNQYDYVLAMDVDNLDDLRRLAGGKRPKIRLFLEAAQHAGTATNKEVPDPYFDGTFERVYDLVARGSVALLAEIRAEYDL